MPLIFELFVTLQIQIQLQVDIQIHNRPNGSNTLAMPHTSHVKVHKPLEEMWDKCAILVPKTVPGASAGCQCRVAVSGGSAEEKEEKNHFRWSSMIPLCAIP